MTCLPGWGRVPAKPMAKAIAMPPNTMLAESLAWLRPSGALRVPSVAVLGRRTGLTKLLGRDEAQSARARAVLRKHAAIRMGFEDMLRHHPGTLGTLKLCS
mmetsp:Transcript_35530/g.66189  ORF Transcript_35530/g.66189 Transcript_35530/m.66189 type:complete len:101 (-) Transcript_35530:17-319(-)